MLGYENVVIDKDAEIGPVAGGKLVVKSKL
jgi:hypothetical protein